MAFNDSEVKDNPEGCGLSLPNPSFRGDLINTTEGRPVTEINEGKIKADYTKGVSLSQLAKANGLTMQEVLDIVRVNESRINRVWGRT